MLNYTQITVKEELILEKVEKDLLLKKRNKNWNEKFAAAYKVVPSDAARKVVIAKVGELYSEVDIPQKKVKIK